MKRLLCECKNYEKIALADIYKGFWKCRDFELSHYWQRAVFLTAFLMACYAGYGAFILSCITAEKLNIGFTIINGVALAISLVGLILSMLWLMMAKGSKTWYERYESAISAFVDKYCENKKVFSEDAGKIAGFRCKHMNTFDEERISDWLWRPCGGTYYVSRINIALGHLSVLIWTCLIVAHLCVAKLRIKTMDKIDECFLFLNWPNFLLAIVVISLLLFWLYSSQQLKSSNLEENC